jgi:hypothetical protein
VEELMQARIETEATPRARREARKAQKRKAMEEVIQGKRDDEALMKLTPIHCHLLDISVKWQCFSCGAPFISDFAQPAFCTKCFTGEAQRQVLLRGEYVHGALGENAPVFEPPMIESKPMSTLRGVDMLCNGRNAVTETQATPIAA